MDGVSKPAEYVLDRSISERPRTRFKGNKIHSRSFHFGTLFIIFGTFSFLKKTALIFWNAFVSVFFGKFFTGKFISVDDW